MTTVDAEEPPSYPPGALHDFERWVAAPIGMMLGVSKRVGESDHRLRRERGFAREELMGRDISGKVLGLVGFGHVGTRVAHLANAFGMTVLAYDPYLSAEEIARRGARSVTMDELLEQSDFVSIHCPRTSETLGMIDARAFARMKKGAVFVTTARGGIHDEAAMFEALQSGHLRGAGVDVWDKEPPPLEHPLLTLTNVIATFHTAGVTIEARRNMAAIAAEQIVGILKGARPPRLAIRKHGRPIAPDSKRSWVCRSDPRSRTDARDCPPECVGARPRPAPSRPADREDRSYSASAV